MRHFNRAEVVVLIILLVVGLALILPWLVNARQDSRLVQCEKNMEDLWVAFDQYGASQGKAFPPGTIANAALLPERRLAWTVTAAAFVEPQVLKSIDLKVAWDDPANKDIKDKLVRRNPLFHCPADSDVSPSDQLQYSSYVGMAGIGKDAPTWTMLRPDAGVWGYDRRTSYADITDGREFTICVLETSANNGPWTAGGPPTIRPLLMDQPLLGDNAQFGGHHESRCVTLLASGTVRVLSTDMEAKAFSRMCTIAGDAKSPHE